MTSVYIGDIWGSGVMVMERTDDDRCPDFNQQFSIVLHFFHLGGIPEVKSHREYRDLCKLMWGRGTSHQRQIAWGPIGSQSPLEFSSDHTQYGLYVIGFIANLQRWAIEPTVEVKWLTNIEVVEGPWWGHQMEATLGQLVSIDSLPSRGSHKKTWASFATEVGPLGPVGTAEIQYGFVWK